MKTLCRILFCLMAINVALTMVDMPRASAQGETEPTGFRDVHLWIYPEYDDPRVLVMLEGKLVGVDVPATARFLVPVAAEMYSAGSMDAQGNYAGGPPHRESSSLPGWDEISYEVTTDTFRVEYYDPIIRGHPDKTISYEFRSLYPIADLTVIIQEPRASSNFSVLPGGDAGIDDEGFAYHSYEYHDLDEDSPLRFDIAYTKSDPNPSLAIKDGGSTNVLVIVGIVAALAVPLGVGVLWVLRSRPRTRMERRYSSRSPRIRDSKGKSPRSRFCSQCGRRLDRSARFCPDCGAKLV